MDYLVVIDMQYDFITGAMANKDAQKILPKIREKIQNFKGTVIYTQSTHYKNYMSTQEAHYLPIVLAVEGTKGHDIESSLLIPKNGQTPDDLIIIEKQSFGIIDNSPNRKGNVWRTIMQDNPSSIELCGTVACYCVLNNTLILKTLYPETPIKVCEDLIASISPESFDATLEAMRNCQVIVYKEPA